MDAAEMKKHSLKNREEKLIQGYYHCINYIDEEIRLAINRGEFSLKVRIITLKFKALAEDFKITEDTIKAVIHHYKRKGINSRLQKISSYKTRSCYHHGEENLILEWK